MESAQDLKAAQQPSPYLNDPAYQPANQAQMPYPGYNAPPPPATHMNAGYPQHYRPMPGNGQVIIVHQQISNMGPCQFCARDVQVLPVRKRGCSLYAWSCILFWVSGCCCWIPCVMDECYDINLKCSACNATRQTIKSRFSF